MRWNAIQTQGVGDLCRIYTLTRRDGVDFNLAYIPPTEPFDQHYMNELFKLGYEMGRKGYPWAKAPPGYKTAVSTFELGGICRTKIRRRNC